MSLDIILFAINHPKMTSDKNHMCDILAVYAKALVNAYLDNNVFHYKMNLEHVASRERLV